MASKVDIDAFLKSLNQDYLPRAHAAIKVAINKFGWFVLGEAQELCPVKTGHLQSSGFATPPTGEGTSTTMEIGFNASYALYVHENLVTPSGKTIVHSQGQAKFLETAIRNHAGELPGYVLQELQKEFA